MQHIVLKFVTDLRQFGDFLQVFRFPQPIKLPATIYLKYCWKWRKTPETNQTIRMDIHVPKVERYRNWNSHSIQNNDTPHQL